ncbi:hypothetical protein BC939DRAFT_443053 [Gamsiella multidivaricata]|uniref:uncharacterized protein n=1 Tax=Gamsiella multidivaricata TaxID=101098 RepID=UPI00221F14E8|nr:uncharacterized protein BC939DRAFT_443053 [Gamsiella multidivaricata]KAI7828825.1 hypothetical protein BC939DRAFT_443053 [Gamsiella multidivaricata]
MDQTPAPTTSRILWVLDQSKKNEHVSLPSFAKHFNYTDRVSANEAFLVLINSSKINERRRKRLEKALAEFKTNREEEFWTNVQTKLNTRVSAKKAAVITQQVGLQQAKYEYTQHSLSQERASQEHHLETLAESEGDTEEGGDDREKSATEGSRPSHSSGRNLAMMIPINYMHCLSFLKGNQETIEEVEGMLSYSMITPFYTLIDYIYRKVRGESAVLPRIPSIISSNHKEMFECAQQMLLDDEAPASRSKGSKTQELVLNKDLLVLLSGIINTIPTGAVDNLSLAAKIKSQSALPSFQVKEEPVILLLEDMLLALCPGFDNDPYAVPHLPSLQQWI